MLYKSVSPDQMQLLVKQHVKDCLDRFMADQMSAPTMDHQLSNITHARLFALIAEDPARWADGSFAQQLDHVPLTATDRANLAELAAWYRQRNGPISPGYMRSALLAAGIEPTETNVRKCLPALAFAKSQACLEANRSTYAADYSLSWDVPAPLADLADGHLSRPLPDSRLADMPPSKAGEGEHSENMTQTDDRFLDAKLSEVADAVADANVAKGTWTSAIKGDVKRAFSFLIAANGDIMFSQLRQHHLAAATALFPRLDPKYRYMEEFRQDGIRGAAAAGAALIAIGVKTGLGLAPQTVNKHLTWMSAGIDEAITRGYSPVDLKFKGLRHKGKSLNKKKANDKRPRWTKTDFITLLTGPVFSGCAGLFRRFESGLYVYHDGAYFGLLLLINTAGRSSEGNGIAVRDVVLDADIPYIIIRENEIRGLKTIVSERRLPILPKLLELGFGDYIRHLQAIGQTAVFPEFVHPTMPPSKCFYKKFFSEQRALHFPQGSSAKINGKDADVVSIRKFVVDILVENLIDAELRVYIAGHEPGAMTQKVYENDPPLSILAEAMSCLEGLFAHLELTPLNPRPIEHMRYGSPRGRRKKPN
jgi:integrase